MVCLEKTVDFITAVGRNNIPQHNDQFRRKNVLVQQMMHLRKHLAYIQFQVRFSNTFDI